MSIDPVWFRRVLSQYPTGVTGVTAISLDGNAIGMAVGSFTSVSLEPALVAFLPDKQSLTWPTIAAKGSFCINVLGAHQETVCRALAARGPDRMRDIPWHPAPSGSPIIDGAVAWVDCELEAVHEAGDHYIVIGQVRALDMLGAELPLLFFRGGYGHFTPLSLVSGDLDVLDQLRSVDLVRGEMEALAADLDTQCTAVVLAQNETILVASAGTPPAGALPPPVGQRFPLTPPLGSVFVAWEAPHVIEAWLRQSPNGGVDEANACRRMVERVRTQGFSLGLGHEGHAQFEEEAARIARGVGRSYTGAALLQSIERLKSGYNLTDITSDSTYEVRHVSAPVFGPDGHVVLEFTVWGTPQDVDHAHVDNYARRLLLAARAATQILGGVIPLAP